jgi:hypothetical protein
MRLENNRGHPTQEITESVTEKVTELVTEIITEVITEPVTELVTKPVTEPVTELVTEAITEPVTEKPTDSEKLYLGQFEYGKVGSVIDLDALGEFIQSFATLAISDANLGWKSKKIANAGKKVGFNFSIFISILVFY